MSAPNPDSSYSTIIGERAVVIGASMAGLFAARALADHFERVTLVERDQLPASPTPRSGVPQARHAHILLVRGRQIIDQLFPGLVQEIIADGAVRLDTSGDIAQLGPNGWAPRVPSGMETISVSRDLLEWRVRQRVLEHPKIDSLQQHDAIGLIASPDNNGISGVQVRSRGSDHAVQTLPASVVVDASGRGSHAAEWLTALGYPAPEITTINAFLGYATRVFAIPDNFKSDWRAMLMQARPPDHKRAAGVLPIEGNRWMVTLAGYGRDYPPTQEAGYMEFARSLAGPQVYDAIRNAEPLSPISGYQRTENQIRHFERLDRYPENFFVLGDAVSAFNPIYGQGMTNAALAAIALDTELRAGTSGASRRFQKRLAAQNTTPWLMATTEDYRFPTTAGTTRGLSTRLSQWYITRVLETAMQNPRVFTTFIGVGHLVTPPSALFAPNITAPVLWHTLTHPNSK